MTDNDPLADLLSAARREVPSSERMAAMTTSLLQRVEPSGGGGGTHGGGGSGAAGSGLGAKAAVSVVAALVVAGGLLHATRTPPEPAPHSMATIPALALPSAREERKSEAIPTVELDDLPKLPDAAAPRVAVPEKSTPKRPAGDALAELRRAQDALASNPARALQLIAEHRRDFPRSAFAQERDVLEIDALIRLGRRSEAMAKADQFARFYPKSGHNRRIDSLLGR